MARRTSVVVVGGLARGRLSGRQLERLVGHVVHLLMLRRELLALLRAMYDFVGAHYHQRVRVWESVAREAHWLAALLPFSYAKLSRPWDVNVTVSGDSDPGDCADPLVWTIPSLAQGATASLYITVTIDEAALGQSIINTASVIGDNVLNPPDPPTPVCPDGSPSVGGVCPNIPVPGTSLALSKTAEDVDGPPVLVGDTLRYTLQVTNTGTYTAFNVIVTDDLPDQVTCRDVWGDNAPAGCADRPRECRGRCSRPDAAR